MIHVRSNLYYLLYDFFYLFFIFFNVAFHKLRAELFGREYEYS